MAMDEIDKNLTISEGKFIKNRMNRSTGKGEYRKNEKKDPGLWNQNWRSPCGSFK
ncbi:hypothetical protein [Alitiscatomonas aceti]|jgi:hypothetical protein|uniref:Uncharacterized protein n=3 Tax=Lachnospiraceae TaxID=186803 RepID=A0ABT2UV99_9FIRM|nr:hypothetical protein [Alitiscatomonas aceti]MCU6798555.1 hypothetical protein [Alitiscatomonas aceti]